MGLPVSRKVKVKGRVKRQHWDGEGVGGGGWGGHLWAGKKK